MRNRTYGGVRGRKTKVGEKLLRFPPTRLVDTCNRLGGTGLWFTEEVDDVGDLHRGELLAVLAVTGGGELLEKVGDALDPSHQVSTGYCWSSIGKI